MDTSVAVNIVAVKSHHLLMSKSTENAFHVHSDSTVVVKIIAAHHLMSKSTENAFHVHTDSTVVVIIIAAHHHQFSNYSEIPLYVML